MMKKNKQDNKSEAKLESVPTDEETAPDAGNSPGGSVQDIDLGQISGQADDEPEALGSEIEQESAFIEDLPGESPFQTLSELKAALESLLFTTTHPLKVSQLRNLLHKVDAKTLRGVLSQLQVEYDARQSGIQIIESAEGYQMCTRPQYATIILQLHRQRKKNPLTTTALETLAIVAYKQPITRAEVEMIRGVESSGVLRNLSDLGLVRVVGRKEVVGRPQLFGTTVQFLRTFGLKTLNELPTIQNLKRQFCDPPGFLADALEETVYERRDMPEPPVVEESQDDLEADSDEAPFDAEIETVIDEEIVEGADCESELEPNQGEVSEVQEAGDGTESDTEEPCETEDLDDSDPERAETPIES